MTSLSALSRRQFLKTSGAVVVGFAMPSALLGASAEVAGGAAGPDLSLIHI